MKYDFCGWATKANIKCADGRTIMKDAFKENDGQTVPLVWNHDHNSPDNVLGHALLKNCEDGVYAYCTLNDTESGQIAKVLIEHGDVSALSIYANKLKQQGGNVLHGAIREVSLVLAGANPGAYIDTVVAHSDTADEEAVIFNGEPISLRGESISLSHSDDESEKKEEKKDDDAESKEDDKKQKSDDEKTVKDVFDSFSEEQKT